jgi:hypothetical protein
MQFPSEALNPRGDHGQKLATLQEEYQRWVLEQALDKQLEDIRRRKAAKEESK